MICSGYKAARLRVMLGLAGLVWFGLASEAKQDPPAHGEAHVAAPPVEPAKDDMFATVIANQKKTEAALDVYERIQKVEYRRTGSDKEPSEVKVWRLFPAGTGVDKIPLNVEGKPANEESYRSDLERLEKMLVWAAQPGAAQRDAYAKVERKKKERMALIESTHAAFVFAKTGEEMRGERKLIRYSMKPNPNYKPMTRNEVVFTRVVGTVWIDEQSDELARIEGHVTEDISLALFLAKVYKGSYFMQERYELFPGVWLPTYEQYDFDGRKFLLSFSIHERTFYTDYRRVGPPTEAVNVVRGELSKLESEKKAP